MVGVIPKHPSEKVQTDMPKPPTYTDQEMREMIVSYYLEHGEFQTIAQVKALGCGDSRAQLLLKEVKNSEGYDVYSQPKPQPQPQPIWNRVGVPEDRVMRSIIIDFEKIPEWIMARLRKLGAVKYE